MQLFNLSKRNSSNLPSSIKKRINLLKETFFFALKFTIKIRQSKKQLIIKFKLTVIFVQSFFRLFIGEKTYFFLLINGLWTPSMHFNRFERPKLKFYTRFRLIRRSRNLFGIQYLVRSIIFTRNVEFLIFFVHF